MAIRLGSLVPLGDATGDDGDSMRSRYSGQFDMELALGAKLSAPVYLGAYAGIAPGNEGNDPYTDQLCSGGYHEVSCSADSARFGVEVQYHFIPDGTVNPWIGYGLAYELAWQQIDDRIARRTETSTVGGFQYGRLQAGMTSGWRRRSGSARTSASKPDAIRTRPVGVRAETYSGAIRDTALHAWFGSGLRLVFLP